MSVTTSLENTDLSVNPGEEATCQVRVRNVGTVVDQFTVDVVGEAANWTQVEPATVNLMPGDVATVAVHFRPPRSSAVRAGAVPFGVRVHSREDPAGSVVDEGVIQVAAFTDIQVELVPPTSHCRRVAKYEVVLDNAGNHPAALELLPSDAEQRLRFRVEHPTLTLEPGTTAFVPLRARPVKRFLRGADKQHPFEVAVLVGGGEPVTTEGTVVQRALLPKWLLPAIAALLVLILVLVVLWYTLVRPAVKSAAREAAAQQASEVASAASQANTKAGQANSKADQANRKADEAKAAAGGDAASPASRRPGEPPLDGTSGTSGTSGSAAGQAIDFRIAVDAAQSPNSATFKKFLMDPPPPDGKTLLVTDILLQNPYGDGGILRILRGDKVMVEVGLNNFRDLDYHLVQPWRFAPGEKLSVAVSCQTPASGTCRPSASFSGRLQD